MNQLPSGCPFTGGEIVVTRFYCPETDVNIEGRFQVPQAPFAQLSQEQLDFVETFVRCEGKLSRMEGELGISYPTVRNRLHEVIRALGYEPGKEESTGPAENERKQILAELDAGEISFDEAMKLLQGESE